MNGADGVEGLLEVAVQAADAAAAELMRRYGGRQRDVRSKSSPTDLVSEADVAAEHAIRELLGRRRPEDAVLGEEGGETGEGRLRWIVDPLDGTINYLFGLPAFAVSVACEDEQGALVGVVLDPVREERFTATREGLAKLNGSEIQASDQDDLAQALVGTGFGYEAAVRTRQAVVVSRVLPQVRDIRRVGAAALDLCWAACGRLDAYYERGVKPWDIAAGALIAERAGLTVRSLPARDGDPAGVLVAPPAVAEELHRLVAGPGA